MLGSSVPPDLLETINSVFFSSIFASMALICAGSVESRTCNSGNPSIFPKVSRSTSGQRLEPPNPEQQDVLEPRLLHFGGKQREMDAVRFLVIGKSRANQASDSRPRPTTAKQSARHKRRTYRFSSSP